MSKNRKKIAITYIVIGLIVLRVAFREFPARAIFESRPIIAQNNTEGSIELDASGFHKPNDNRSTRTAGTRGTSSSSGTAGTGNIPSGLGTTTGTTTQTGGNSSTTNTQIVPLSERLSHRDACGLLARVGIDLFSSTRNLNCSDTSSRISLEGAPATAIQKLIQLAKDCKCSFDLMGGTETSIHGPNTEHGPGKSAFDLKIKGNTTYAKLETAVRKAGWSLECDTFGKESPVPCSSTDIRYMHIRI